MRRRYIQIDGELVEVTLDYVPELTAKHHIIGDRHYDGLRSPVDGEDISTRTKHREYMKRKGLTTIDDFQTSWSEAAKKRAEYYEGRDPKRREDIARAIHNLETKEK